MRKLLRHRKALSPVVAAIILIAVTVAVSIAVAAWMGALTFTFMKTEELRITSHEWGSIDGSKITLYVRNTGTASLTIDYAEINSKKVTDLTFDPSGANPLDPGNSVAVEITNVDSVSFSPGVKYEFAVVTKTGGRFVYMAVAPS